MQFATYYPAWDWVTKRLPKAEREERGVGTPGDFYRTLVAHALVNRAKTAPEMYVQGAIEGGWIERHRPYYCVWPSIVPLLTKLKLDLDSSLIKVPFRTICIRLPEQGNPLEFQWNNQSHFIRAVLFGEVAHEDLRRLAAFMDCGEGMAMDGECDLGPVATYQVIDQRPGVSVEQAIAALRGKELSPEFSRLGVQIPYETILDCFRLACTLCLLENDPAIINPDVFADDRQKFADSGDLKYVEKAHRRGKIGWNVGAKLESVPHYRRPHPALYHVGKGRTESKIIFRAGSIVHRDVVERIPTGFQG